MVRKERRSSVPRSGASSVNNAIRMTRISLQLYREEKLFQKLYICPILYYWIRIGDENTFHK